MGKEILKLVITGFISGGFAYWLALNTFEKQNKIDEQVRMNENLNKILDINLEYPFLENSKFINRWNQGEVASSDSSIRYQNYCLYILNFSETVLKYYNYDTLEVGKNYDLKELLKPHCGWWKIPPPPTSYSEKMKVIVDSYCK